MELFIDTTDPELVRLQLVATSRTLVHEFMSGRDLSERLILEIQKFLKQEKVQIINLTSIEAHPGPGGFSRIRTAIATVNAVAFGLSLKQKLVSAHYDSAPNITLPKRT